MRARTFDAIALKRGRAWLAPPPPLLRPHPHIKGAPPVSGRVPQSITLKDAKSENKHNYVQYFSISWLDSESLFGIGPHSQYCPTLQSEGASSAAAAESDADGRTDKATRELRPGFMALLGDGGVGGGGGGGGGWGKGEMVIW